MSVKVLNDMLRPLVESLGYEFVGLEYNPGSKHSVLRVYIDQEEGIGIDDCETVSREIAALLDVKDPIRGQFNLEVSSPGLARPLFTPEHFTAFEGFQVKVNLYAPVEGRRKFNGPILETDEGTVTVDQDGARIQLAYDNIAKARLVPDYDSILAGGNKE